MIPLTDILCDPCLAKTEAHQDFPMSELCDRCKVKIVDWTIETLGLEGAERMCVSRPARLYTFFYTSVTLTLLQAD